jgi:hypothetical protein
MGINFLPHTCHMSCPSHSLWLTWIIFDLKKLLLCSFLQSPATLSLWSTNIFSAPHSRKHSGCATLPLWQSSTPT